jgi:hypothetical protein
MRHVANFNPNDCNHPPPAKHTHTHRLLLPWTPTHSEQFFSLLITSVDSHTLCTHVSLALAQAICHLGDDFTYTQETKGSEVGERLVRLCGMFAQ